MKRNHSSPTEHQENENRTLQALRDNSDLLPEVIIYYYTAKLKEAEYLVPHEIDRCAYFFELLHQLLQLQEVKAAS